MKKDPPKQETKQEVKKEEPKEEEQSSEDCDIKGSKNGIYHVPGSTYYSRTTNVVEWFCSPADAETAGYRAPKR